MAAPPPPEEALEALCEVLHAHGVRYVVFGSVAGRLHGADLGTIDVDLVPDTGADNLERLAGALNTLAPRWRVAEEGEGMAVDGRIEARHFRGDSLAVGLVTSAGYVDVVLAPAGFEEGYAALAPHAVAMTVGGVEVLVGALDDLIVSKELLGRDKDLLHLPALRRRAEELRVEPGRPPSARTEDG